MISIREVKLQEVRGIIEPLLTQHWGEIANYKDTVPLEPDWSMYEKLEAKGAFWACVVEEIKPAYKENGEEIFLDNCPLLRNIIGYSAFYISNHPHYKSLRVAENDVIYLHPEYRKTGIGLKLIQESEKMLKDLGVQKIQWHVKLKHDFTPLLERLGYRKEDILMGKIV